MPAKLWLLRDGGETYALCSLCVLHRELGVYVDYGATPADLAEVVATQNGRCRAEIEDVPDCRSRVRGSDDALGNPDPSPGGS